MYTTISHDVLFGLATHWDWNYICHPPTREAGNSLDYWKHAFLQLNDGTLWRKPTMESIVKSYRC